MRGITTPEMEVAVAVLFNPRVNIIVPNISFGARIHECDIFILKPTGYAAEVEIKISKSDLIADSKKRHKHKSNLLRELYFAIPECHIKEWEEYIPERAGVILVRQHEAGFCRAYIHRNSKINTEARKLTDKEKINIGRLGCMRIWNLKRAMNGKLRNG